MAPFSSATLLLPSPIRTIRLQFPLEKAYGRQAAGVSKVFETTVSDYREVGGQGVMARVEGHDVMAGNDRLLHSLDIPHDTCCIDGTAVHVAVDGTYAGYLVMTRPGRARPERLRT